MRKPTFCVCGKTKTQISFAVTAPLFSLHIDSTIPLHSKSEIANLSPSSVVVQPGLCGTWSETILLVLS